LKGGGDEIQKNLGTSTPERNNPVIWQTSIGGKPKGPTVGLGILGNLLKNCVNWGEGKNNSFFVQLKTRVGSKYVQTLGRGRGQFPFDGSTLRVLKRGVV